MAPITFNVGSTVTLLGTVHTVTGISDNNLVHLKTDCNVQKSLTLQTLFGHHSNGNLRPGPKGKVGRGPHAQRTATRCVRFNAIDHSDQAIKQGFHRREILKDLNASGARIREDDEDFKRTVKATAERLGLNKPPCARTVLRWHSRNLLIEQNQASFIPRFCNRGGKSIARSSQEVQQHMDDVTLNEYMTIEKKSVAVCFQKLRAVITSENKLRPGSDQLKAPSKNTFQRWINLKPAYDVYAARNGKAAADLRFRSSDRNPETWNFMECVEVDHTVLDLMVVDEKEGLVLGRPRFTLFIEWSTRACLGFTLGFEGTSTQTVLECLRTAVSPKDDIVSQYPSVKNSWQCWGLPRYLKLDNGPEFHSLTFLQTLADLGVDLIYCPRKKPWFKGRVERAIKRMNTDLMATLPGATLTQLYNRVTGNDPSEFAVIDINTLRHILHIWVVDIYHQEFHRGIKKTPHKAWEQAFDLTKVALPADMALLEVLCSELAERTVFHYGIEICGERSFNSPALQDIRRRRQLDAYVKVKVRYRPALLDRIWVYDEAQETWMEVMNSNPLTRDLSEFQLKMIHKMQREEADRGDVISIAEARERMKALVEPMLRAKTQSSRKRALKLLGWTTDPEVLTPNKSLLETSTEPAPPAEAKRSKPKSHRKTKPTKKQDVQPKITEEFDTLASYITDGHQPAPSTTSQPLFEGNLPTFETTVPKSAAAMGMI